MHFKSAFIALLGRPNSGKSTLLNTILGEKISIVTSLPQTTQQNIRGIYTTEKMQLIFIDTPGIHKGTSIFNKTMLQQSESLLRQGETDLICYIVDLSRDFGEEESRVSGLVRSCNIPAIIIFNKTDLCKESTRAREKFFELYPYHKNSPSLSLSALSEEDAGKFLHFIEPFIPQGPLYFPDDILCDSNLRQIASEYIRKQIILNSRDEVPHATFVEIESYKESNEKHLIVATIHVETKGQRGIIIGEQGKVINRIKKDARIELSKIVGTPVSLSLHVKVTPGWRNNRGFLKFVGLQQ